MARVRASFSPVSRIHSIATPCGNRLHSAFSWVVSVPFPGFTQLQLVSDKPTSPTMQLFQSRFQDSLNCNPSSKLTTSIYGCCFSPVSRIHSIATDKQIFQKSRGLWFQSRFQDSLNCNRKQIFQNGCSARFQSRFQDSLNCNPLPFQVTTLSQP